MKLYFTRKGDLKVFERAVGFVLSATASYQVPANKVSETVDNREYTSLVEAVNTVTELANKLKEKEDRAASAALELSKKSQEFLGELKLLDKKKNNYSISKETALNYDTLIKQAKVEYEKVR